MRSFLIHKNRSFYHWLKRRIGRQRALRVENTVEKIILDIEIFFLFGSLMIGGIILFWFFLVFLNLTSF